MDARGQVRRVRTLVPPSFRDLSSIRSVAMPMTIMIDMSSKSSCLRGSLPRSRRPWTLKSWLCRSRCLRRCPASISGRRRRNTRRSTSRRSAGRLNSILRKRINNNLLTVREPVVSSLRTQKSSQSRVSASKKMISSLLPIREVLQQISTLISEVEQAPLAVSLRRQITQADQKCKRVSPLVT